MASGLEAAHRPLALSRRLMRVFRTIVQPFVLAMLDTRHDFRLGCLIAAELVRDQHARDVGAALEQFAEELLGSTLVASALHQDIKHVPVLIHGAPEVGRFPVDLQKHLVGRRDTFRHPTPHWNRACDINRTRLGQGDTFQSAGLACLTAGRLRSCTLVHA